jgi:alkyl hydroperoxide reductase subunit AhpC
MTLRLGDSAPDFVQDSTEGKIHFNEWRGNSWVVLFSHPADFTPVCTTELGLVARLKPEFDKRNVKVIGLSVDPLDAHARWTKDIAETQGASLNYPLLADVDRKVATAYDMLQLVADPETPVGLAPTTATVRSVFVIDPKGTIRMMLTYPASTGRNFDEILRVIDALQLTDNSSVATPANWQPGQDVVILPSVPSEQADKMFPKGYREVKPYLRVTPDPTR